VCKTCTQVFEGVRPFYDSTCSNPRLFIYKRQPVAMSDNPKTLSILYQLMTTKHECVSTCSKGLEDSKDKDEDKETERAENLLSYLILSYPI